MVIVYLCPLGRNCKLGFEPTILVPQNAWWVVTLACHPRIVRLQSLQMPPPVPFGPWVVGVLGLTHLLEEILQCLKLALQLLIWMMIGKIGAPLGAFPS